MKKVLLFSGLCGLSALLLLARSPGGVEGVDAWFKAAPVSGNLQGRYQWLDFSGDSVVQYAQNRVSGSYVFTQDRTLLKSLNFNPALDFSKGDTPKWSELRRSSLIQGTIIGVFAPYTFGNRIDVENPNPGKRKGQIHFQDKQHNKYLYNGNDKKFYSRNPKTGNWDVPAPKRVNEQLSNPDVQRAIQRGEKYLGNE